MKRRGHEEVEAAAAALAAAAPPRLLSDWELWACANHYVSAHGEDAPIFAALRVDALLAADDLDGANNFLAILRRIHILLGEAAGAPH